MTFPLLVMLTNVVGSPDTEAPTVPQNLVATAVSASQIDLTWDASTDNVGVDHYNVYRDGGETPIAQPTGTSYSDTGLTASTTYSYTVSAEDVAGNESAESASANDTTQARAYFDDAVALGPIRYYRMGDTSASQMLDASGNDKHGSYSGAPLFGQTALVEDADGDSATRLFVGDDYGIAPAVQSAEMTLVMTIELADVAGQSVLASADNGLPDDGWSFEVQDGGLRAYIRSAAGSGTAQWINGDTVGVGTITADTRHTVALSFGAAGAELWIDGTRVAQDVALTDGPVNNTAQLNVGTYALGVVGMADGFIDEVLVFNYQLDASQHTTLARADLSTPPPLAKDDAPASIEEETGDHDFDVLANDTWHGIPTITIVSQSGPTTASIVGTGASSLIRVPTDTVEPGTQSVTYELSNDASAGTSQATLAVEITEAAGVWGTYVTGIAAFVRSPPAKPAYRTEKIEEDFGVRIIRVGLEEGVNIPNINQPAPSWHRHFYSTKQCWNADETILKLGFLQGGAEGYQGWYFMDGQSYEYYPWGRRPLISGMALSGQWVWHPKDPARMIGLRNGNELVFYLPETNSIESITTFSGESGLIQTSTGNASDAIGATHPRVFCRRGTGSGASGFVYDIDTDTKFPVWSGTASDWSGMDHTGEHVISQAPNNLRAHDVNGNLLGVWTNNTKHADVVWSAGQTEQYVVFHSNGDLIRARWPQIDQDTILVANADTAVPDHCSGRHIVSGNPFEGWVIVWAIEGPPDGVLEFEVFAARLSDGLIRRLAHAYTFRGGGDNYPHEAHPSVSPNGTRMIFASRWSTVVGEDTTDVQSYVIESFDFTPPWPR